MGMVIKGAGVVTPAGVKTTDLRIDSGKVSSIGRVTAVREDRVIEGRGKLLFAGGIDPHVHLEQLTASGQTSSDDFAGGCRAALFGGTTTLGDFAYPDPGERLIAAWKRRRALLSSRVTCRVFFHVTISEETADLEEEIDECLRAGVGSFKVHLNDLKMNRKFLDRICRHLARREALLLVHAEQGEKIAELTEKLRREGKTGLSSHALGHPAGVEAGAVREALTQAREHGTRIYIVHLSTRAGLEIVREFREGGSFVRAETCPQYLLLTEEKYREADGYCYTCVPPFRKEADREALWEGLADGSIDLVSTDHCPFTRAQKDTWEGDFTRIPGGLPGVETRIPLFFSEGRRRGFSWEKLSGLVSGRAAEIFGLERRGVIREGAAADLFLYDPEERGEIDYRRLHMNCDFSPYQGMKFRGRPVLTIRGGEAVARAR
jgi:dihydropyrimidinase